MRVYFEESKGEGEGGGANPVSSMIIRKIHVSRK